MASNSNIFAFNGFHVKMQYPTLPTVGDSLPYSKKEKKKTIKQLDKLAKKENLKVGYVGIGKKSNRSWKNGDKKK